MKLLRDRAFALLFLGQAVNGIGSWAALVALWGFAAYHFDSGPEEVALIGLSWALPAALIGPIAGVPVDRLGPKRVLALAYGAGVIASIAAAFATSFSQLVALGALHGLVKAFSQPAANSLPPRLVADRDLLPANALLGAAQESAIVFGPLVAAASIAVGGLRAAFVVDAATFVIGALALIPLRLRPAEPVPRARLRSELLEGVRVARNSPSIRFTLGLALAVFLTWGTYVVVEPIYVRDVLGAPASFFAMLQTAFGVGLVATGLLLTRIGDRAASERALAVSVLLSGVTAALYVGTRIEAVAVAGVFLWGVDVAFFSAPSRTLLQRHSPPHAHGRVLALYGTFHSIGDLIALPLAGVAAGFVGVQATAFTAAALAVVVGAIALVRAPSIGRRPDPNAQPAPALDPAPDVAPVDPPIFVPLSTHNV